LLLGSVSIEVREGPEVAFTMLRSFAFAWHDPAVLEGDRHSRYTDQGERRSRFTIRAGAAAGRSSEDALAMHRSTACFDWTRGMLP
jgi:hypothetical protein